MGWFGGQGTSVAGRGGSGADETDILAYLIRAGSMASADREVLACVYQLGGSDWRCTVIVACHVGGVVVMREFDLGMES